MLLLYILCGDFLENLMFRRLYLHSFAVVLFFLYLVIFRMYILIYKVETMVIVLLDHKHEKTNEVNENHTLRL